MICVIHFARFGPYHLARLDSAHRSLSAQGDWTLIGLETAGADQTYAWRKEAGSRQWQRVTVFPEEAAEAVSPSRLKRGMNHALDRCKADAVVIAGWGSTDARACLSWCKRKGALAIVMSETRYVDGERVWWKERLKRRLVRQFDAGLVGGRSHRDYLGTLGIPTERVAYGYNVVDNEFFTEQVARKEHLQSEGPERNYLLSSNRFLKRKNLAALLRAFGQGKIRTQSHPWSLILLGDGEESESLMSLCAELSLKTAQCAPWELEHSEKVDVFFPGFRQIDELPRFYALSRAFIHPALSEPWGLVINEAMAAGLPILSSTNVGAAEELVDNQVNGWLFDPSQDETIQDALIELFNAPAEQLYKMGQQSQKILEERCPLGAFGEGVLQCLNFAKAKE